MALDRWPERFNSNSGDTSSSWRALPWSLLDRFLFSSSCRNRSAPYVRNVANVQSILNNFVIASIPCWMIGLWSFGHLSSLAIADSRFDRAPGWRGDLIELLATGYEPTNAVVCFFHGLLYFLPIFLVALVAVSTWEIVFSAVRRRPLSDGVLAFAWLFSMAMPAGVDFYKVGLGASFGYVAGCAIYGGSGRYLVNPALLGVTFLLFAYPDIVFGPQNWIPIAGVNTIPALKLAVEGGVSALQSASYSWLDLFFGVRPGPLGTVSVLGCLLGAIYLVVTDSASWRIMLGALLGMTVATALVNAMASEVNGVFAIGANWHLVLGTFAFGVIFFATDPVPAATTAPGRWVFGFLVGALTIVIRVSSPSYNEGVIFAILLASLFSPVIDFVVAELNIRRRQRRQRRLTASGP